MNASPPKFSVCEITTLPRSFAEDVEMYGTAGVSGIGLFEQKLEGLSDEEIRASLRIAGLQPTACITSMLSILPVPAFPGPTDPDERIVSLCDSVRLYGRLGAVASLCITGAIGDYSGKDARRIVVEGLREIARTADEAGIEFGIEPLSAVHSADWTLITGIEDSIELMDEVGEPNLKLVFDTWHLWNTDRIDELTERHCARFMSVVHINDWRDPTRGWADRALPGEGIMDLAGLFRALIRGGFDGWYDLEIFSDDGRFGNDYPDSLWRADPVSVIERARKGLLAAWHEAARSA